MELEVKWQAPIELLDGEKKNLIYFAEGLNEWQDEPGVYMFARIFNGEVYPLYIGKAESLGARIWQHFKNSTRLMYSIKRAKNGSKVLILGHFSPKPGQSTKTCIGLIERALIDHVLTAGYKIFNIQGTRAASHTINFTGNLPARKLTGKKLSFTAGK